MPHFYSYSDNPSKRFGMIYEAHRRLRDLEPGDLRRDAEAALIRADLLLLIEEFGSTFALDFSAVDLIGSRRPDAENLIVNLARFSNNPIMLCAESLPPIANAPPAAPPQPIKIPPAAGPSLIGYRRYKSLIELTSLTGIDDSTLSDTLKTWKGSDARPGRITVNGVKYVLLEFLEQHKKMS